MGKNWVPPFARVPSARVLAPAACPICSRSLLRVRANRIESLHIKKLKCRHYWNRSNSITGSLSFKEKEEGKESYDFLPVLFANTLLKKVSGIPVPSRDVTYQTLHGRECLLSDIPGDIPAGDGNTANIFFTVQGEIGGVRAARFRQRRR
jgi:hypothetical protein